MHSDEYWKRRCKRLEHDMMECHRIVSEEARNALMRSIGASKEGQYEHQECARAAYDAFMLADGLIERAIECSRA